MKKTLCLSALLLVAALLFTSARSFSGELQFLWSNTLDSGYVLDMEFMPDNNYFIMGTYYYTQIRETATGNVVQTYPFYLSHIEFTPDSTRMITQHEYNIQLRNINDLSVIKQYTLPWGTDTTDLNYEVSGIGWTRLVVDPIRPLCYAIRSRSGYISNNVWVNIQKIIIYNYETMEEVGKLTSPAEDTLWYKDIAISKDGKYLAAITLGTSYIKVWDLNTRQKIRDFKVCDYYKNVGGGSPSQLTFSQINTDNIYFSGSFPQSKNTWYDGILLYNIAQNRITDSTFAVGLKYVFSGKFCLFDNEERMIKTRINKIIIMNNITKQWEQEIDKDTISGGQIFWGFQRYSEFNKFILGFSQSGLSCIKNNLGTTVPIQQFDFIIYPNPTTSDINIERDCLDKFQSYSITDLSGNILTSINEIPPDDAPLTISFFQYPSGIYYIRYTCGTFTRTYKVIKG